MRIGIDASNIKDSGGLKHLIELISHGDISKHNISKVIVVGGNQLDYLPDKEWLEKKKINLLVNGGFFLESIWKLFYAEKEFLKIADIVFAPGGTFYSKKIPYVSMSQNMLVFDKEESKRYGLSWTRLRLFLLNKLQSKSFKGASGVIFISYYAFHYVSKLVPELKNKGKVINFGSSKIFSNRVKSQENIKLYSLSRPYKIVYISKLDYYKHQINVVFAIDLLIKKGYPLELILIGPKSQRYYNYFQREISKIINIGFLKYLGPKNYYEINEFYSEANLFVFASSCENMPNILIEAMESGLPIACSRMGPMREFLKNAGVYFDPLDFESIAHAIENLIINPGLRYENAKNAQVIVKDLTWDKCSDMTFEFINTVYQKCI